MKNLSIERRSRIYLFLSLCLLLIIPFLHQCVRTNLISDVPDTDGLGIAGHIEWFDGIVYSLYRCGVFSASIEFICYLFGFGMCVNAICGTLLFARWERNTRLTAS